MPRARLTLVSSLAPCLFACATTVREPPPEAPAAPRGDALRAAVLGEWEGTAEDGTPTTVPVTLSLSDDGEFDLSAGLVNESFHWEVRDDLVVLLPDPDAQAADGICFRATRINARRIEGTWAYTEGSLANLRCADPWYPVTLDRADR